MVTTCEIVAAYRRLYDTAIDSTGRRTDERIQSDSSYFVVAAAGVQEDDPGAPEIPSITKVNLVGFDGFISVAIDGLGKLANPILTSIDR